MTEYASLFELERIALWYRDELLGEGKEMEAVAQRVGAPLCSLDELDSRIEGVAEQHQPSFELRQIPQLWLYLGGILITDINIVRWFDDPEAFRSPSRGFSARDKLSVLESTAFSSNVREVAGIFYESLGFATVPPLPSERQLLYVTRLAQAEQLGLM